MLKLTGIHLYSTFWKEKWSFCYLLFIQLFFGTYFFNGWTIFLYTLKYSYVGWHHNNMDTHCLVNHVFLYEVNNDIWPLLRTLFLAPTFSIIYLFIIWFMYIKGNSCSSGRLQTWWLHTLIFSLVVMRSNEKW